MAAIQYTSLTFFICKYCKYVIVCLVVSCNYTINLIKLGYGILATKGGLLQK